MKLFPEQNPHMSHPAQQLLLQQHPLSSNQQSSNLTMLSGSQGSINQSCNFPLAMDCDPPIVTSSTINTRYGGHSHRGRFPTASLMQQPLQNVGHKTNYLNNYAPTSLPIELSQIGGNGSSTLTSGYPLNLSGNGGGGGNSSNSKINARSNVSNNDRDESPMMCIQQSPVVIH